MKLTGLNIGVALTGSFCTYEKVFDALKELANTGATIHTILSDSAQTISNRFGTPDETHEKILSITGNEPLTTIAQVEPIGPKSYLDALIILPCTGNTAAKLANGITDTPVLMAAKAHLRNNKPLIISISTNDGLGMNLKNIGQLLNTKNIFFVPFGQDNFKKKPNSLVADTSFLIETTQQALEGTQIQPILVTY